MNAVAPIVVVTTLAAAGYGIYKIAEAKTTAEDLKMTVEGFKFNPLKDIKGGKGIIRLTMGFGNMHTGTIHAESVDLDLYFGETKIGQVRDYNLDTTIKPLALTTKDFTGTVTLASVGKALGLPVLERLISLIMGTDDGKQKKIADLFPKEVSAKGSFRANGITLQIDSKYPLQIVS